MTHPIFNQVANIANRRVHQSRSLDVATEKCSLAAANNDDLLRQMAALTKKKKYIKSQQSTCKDRSTKIQQ